MTEPDTMTDVYRRLALALEPDLVEVPLVWSAALLRETPDLDLVSVRNDRGLLVTSRTALGAWTAALAACQRRAAWRTMKATRKAETAPPPPPGPPPVGAFWLGQVPTPAELRSRERFEPIGQRPGPRLYVDDDPDGAA